MCKVTVILPIYNVDNYLKQSIESVINQSFKNIEVILVDDGSTDDSPTICETYVEVDKRIKVIHKIHRGLSDARNAGIKIASGEWIFFLDADDWLASNAIETLLAYAENNFCDIVQCNFFYSFSKYNATDIDSKLPNMIHCRQGAMKLLVRNDTIKNFAWGKLYKAELVKNHLFDIGKYFEDSYWQYKIIDQCTRFGVVTQPLYYYRQRKQSISGEFSIRNLDLLYGQLQRLKFIDIHYPELTTYAFRTLWSTALQAKLCAKRCSHDIKEAYNDFWGNELVTSYNRYNLKYWSTKDKVAYMLSVKHPKIYPLFDLACRIHSHISFMFK
jgi:glycosyltransferase involved in cell wall biosynthesis